MKNIRLILGLLVLLTAFACSDDNNPDLNQKIFGLGGDSWPRTELDEWLLDHFVKPYNIEVKYHWDAFELEYGKTLVPPKQEYIIPIMSMIKELWIDTYEQCAGSNFIKKISPKKCVLVGSAKYEKDGTFTLGEAEGGRKIVLYRVNAFDPSDEDLVKLYMHTVYHEFTHILHQTISYDNAFAKLSAGQYNPTGWTDTKEDEAQESGFVSPYASSAVDEDFAETVSLILTNGRDWFEDYIYDAGETGGAILRAKEAIIVEYFKTAWNIDFYETDTGEKGLVPLVQKAIFRFVDEAANL